MGKFVYFTSAEKRQANEVDLPSFLLDRGEKLIMAGRDYRLASDHSITVRGPMWYDHAARKGGRAISFVQQFYDKTYPEAVTMLLGRDGQGIIPIVKKEPESREPKPFALPEAYLNMRRLYAYLTTHRRIDRDVVTEFVQEKLLYEDALHHNCVFVGVDENGEARHAHLRSTNSQGKVFRINVEGSEAKHSFHKDGTDCSLYVFEAPIDLLSHITLYPAGWLEHSYVACCGTSVQPVLERLRLLYALSLGNKHTGLRENVPYGAACSLGELAGRKDAGGDEEDGKLPSLRRLHEEMPIFAEHPGAACEELRGLQKNTGGRNHRLIKTLRMDLPYEAFCCSIIQFQ